MSTTPDRFMVLDITCTNTLGTYPTEEDASAAVYEAGGWPWWVHHMSGMEAAAVAAASADYEEVDR